MSTKHLITPSLCRQWNAYYSDDNLHTLLGDGLTPLQLLDLDIPIEHKIWAVVRPEIMSLCDLRLFACWCATHALEAERAAGREPDERSWAAVSTAERFARGSATQKELDAAWDAAGDAAGDAQINQLRTILRKKTSAPI